MYALSTIGVIALGLALATTTFSVVDGVLFEPLPYPGATHVFAVRGGWTALSRRRDFSILVHLHAWRTAAPEARFAFATMGGRLAADANEPVRAAWASRTLPTSWRQPPMIGAIPGGTLPLLHRRRAATDPDSYGLWRARYGGDASAIGAIVHGESDLRSLIVGVLPADFLFPTSTAGSCPKAAPLPEPPDIARDRGRGLIVIARTAASMDAAAFRARIDAAAAQLKIAFPRQPKERGAGPYDFAIVEPADLFLGGSLADDVRRGVCERSTLVLLACLNIAGLAGSRVHDRLRELSLRRALGGGRAEVVRLLAAEMVAIVGCGAVLGIAGAVWLVHVVGSLLPDTVTLLKPLTVDLRVIVFAVMASAVSVAMTTVVTSRAAFGGDLRASIGGRSEIGRTHNRARFAMVSLQVGIGLVMAIGGALVAGSLMRVWSENPGYDPSNTLYLSLRPRAQTTMATNESVLDAIRAVPGVTAAGASNAWYMARAFGGTSWIGRPRQEPSRATASTTRVSRRGSSRRPAWS